MATRKIDNQMPPNGSNNGFGFGALPGAAAPGAAPPGAFFKGVLRSSGASRDEKCAYSLVRYW